MFRLHINRTDICSIKIPFLIFLVLLFIITVNSKSYTQEKVYTSFTSSDKEIALTFDACESNAPAYMDTSILNFIIKEKIPCTIFLGGKFCKRNMQKVKEISKYSFIDFGNHSYSHFLHMEKLPDETFIKEIKDANDIIKDVIGRQPRFFRFPAGNYSAKTLHEVSELGLKTVHWSFASGDPDKKLSAGKIKNWVLAKAKPGSILIFHINGRGYHTGEILPQIVKTLKAKQYKFVLLKDVNLK
mgnify:CR=1 FL=1